jgi:tRNA(Ile)-lysidine synthase
VGLKGIPRVRRLTEATTLLRPLLAVRRADLRNYLAALGQPFREDSSNTDVHFTRNRIRHELLPLARSCYPAVDEALRRLSTLAGEAQSIIAGLIDELIETAVTTWRPDHIVLNAALLADVEPYLARELFLRVWREMHWPQQGMTLQKWTELAELLDATLSGSQTITFPGVIRATKTGGSLTLSRPSN